MHEVNELLRQEFWAALISHLFRQSGVESQEGINLSVTSLFFLMHRIEESFYDLAYFRAFNSSFKVVTKRHFFELDDHFLRQIFLLQGGEVKVQIEWFVQNEVEIESLKHPAG